MKQYRIFSKKTVNYYFVGFLFILIGFSLYANSFSNQMFWDDDEFILKNRFIKDWQYFPKFFSENLIAGSGILSNYWRPALLSIFALEWHLWQDWAVGYHLVNALFHVACAILLFFILVYFFHRFWLAFWTAMVFLVHPLQTEAVTYVNSLGDSLSVFFIFLGIIFYLKSHSLRKSFRTKLSYFLSLVMYILALMSKETAIIMPALILTIDFFFINSKAALTTRFKAVAKSVWPFFILGISYVILRATVLNFVNTFNFYNEVNIFTSNFHVRLFTFFRILTVYFKLFFWPIGLHMERSVEIATSMFSLSVVAGGAIFFGLIFLAVAYVKRFPILSFGILWFFISLFPTSNLIVPINGLLYEHWLYLPMIGIFLCFVWLGMFVVKKTVFRRGFLIIFVLFLVFLGALTVSRNKVWRNPIIFYQQTLKYAPNSYRVINNLGMAYADIGDYQQAEETYKMAIALDGYNPVAYHNLGNTYKAIGKKQLAEECFLIAIEKNPDFSFSYKALAQLYFEDQEYWKARKILEKYLNRTSSKTDVLSLLAQIAVKEGNLNAALFYLEVALKIETKNQQIQKFITDVKSLMFQIESNT